MIQFIYMTAHHLFIELGLIFLDLLYYAKKKIQF